MSNLQIVYDGDCPFCSDFVALREIDNKFGGVELINARETHDAVESLDRCGIDLDDGIVVIFEGQIICGADAMNFLSRSSSARNRWGALQLLLRNSLLARALYPILKLGRSITLKLMGRPRIPKSR